MQERRKLLVSKEDKSTWIRLWLAWLMVLTSLAAISLFLAVGRHGRRTGLGEAAASLVSWVRGRSLVRDRALRQRRDSAARRCHHPPVSRLIVMAGKDAMSSGASFHASFTW
jgi:hypothetical protein